MAQFDSSEMSRVHATCLDNLSAVTESFNQCFLTDWKFEGGELKSWSAADAPMEFLAPGLLLSFEVSGNVVLAVLPESLPLPGWCRDPDKSESSRLQTLPLEWSMNVFPEDRECESNQSEFFEDLSEAIRGSEPREGSFFFKLGVSGSSGGGGVYFIGACCRKPVLKSGGGVDEPVFGGGSMNLEAQPVELSPEEEYERQQRLRRAAQIMNIPVPIIVVMAEKRMELGQLMTMGPGTIISFEKSCDDLLDLCVNNRAICSGEAVKIGEKFGLKVNHLSSIADRMKAMQRSRVI